MSQARPELRVVLLGASHWHVPLYIDEIARRCRVVAVSDRDPGVAERIAARFGAAAQADWRAALELSQDADIAFVFGRHIDMAEMADAVLDAGIALAIEKPGALDADRVTLLADKARRLNVPTAVPFIQRIGPVAEALRSVGQLRYACFQFVAGPPDRYLRDGNEWMLDPELAGGGCFINLGIHFVDLFRSLAGERIDDQVGRFFSTLHHRAVEDQAFVTLATPSGAGCLIQVGYSFPEHPIEKRYVAYSASGTDGFVSIDTHGALKFAGVDGSTRTSEVSVDTDLLYAAFVSRLVESLPTGFAGLPGLAELAEAMVVVDAAYSSSGHDR